MINFTNTLELHKIICINTFTARFLLLSFKTHEKNIYRILSRN